MTESPVAPAVAPLPCRFSSPYVRLARDVRSHLAVIALALPFGAAAQSVTNDGSIVRGETSPIVGINLTGGYPPVTITNNGSILTVANSGHGIAAGTLGINDAYGNDTSALPIQVTHNGQIFTSGSQAVGIVATSVGGRGRDGSDGGRGDPGGNGGKIEIFGSGSIRTANPVPGGLPVFGNYSAGILAMSAGGRGGEGGDGGVISGGGSGGDGGNGGLVFVKGSWNITTEGNQAQAIWAKSVGGHGGPGGSGGWFDGGAGGGGIGAQGGTVAVESGGLLSTRGTDSIGILAQSIGGYGGSGGDGNGIFSSKGGTGDPGGHAGAVTVSTLATSAITTAGATSHGILAQSIGGSGGSGGDGANAIVATGGGTNAGGNGSAVRVDNLGSITATGAGSKGIIAQSIGGGGGHGGNGDGLVGIGGSGSVGSAGGAVQVLNQGNVTSSSSAIFTQSIGGGGGSGGSGSGWFSIGGSGGGGGNGSEATVTSHGSLRTTEFNSSAIVAQSVGGGGGNGGSAISAGSAIAVAIGSAGGTGGSGGNVTVADTRFGGARRITGSISTQGDNSNGIQAQSVGGGGGNGGFAIGAAVGTVNSAAISLGGSGGGGGSGGSTAVYFGAASDKIETTGRNSNAIVAQSIGGGGGNGGMSVAGAAGMTSASLSMGGSGGNGGSGGDVTVGGVRGTLATTGEHSYGILAQSVGGGGGNGGLSVSGGTAGALAAGVSFGGKGGLGGEGGTVSVTNDARITTAGNDSHGVFGQSVGGGGGSGGGAIAGELAGVALGASFGGVGGDAQKGQHVSITSLSNITTAGDRSNGVFAQSVGGGGGDGGFSVAGGAAVFPSATLSMGGSGASGGAGGAVDLFGGGEIKTSGQGSTGLFAQSVGGGGGSGGMSVAATATLRAGAMAASVGGSGGSGGAGGEVNLNAGPGKVTTSGNDARGIVAESIGGGGGSGGMSVAGSWSIGAGAPSGAVSVAVGGSGGSGNLGGNVTVTNMSSVTTDGAQASGLVARSVGGGGGTGGLAIAVAIDQAGETGTKSLVSSTAVGGSGGAGNFSGTVGVTNEQAITTRGQDASGIVAQSIGGGGGSGGSSVGLDLGMPGPGKNIALNLALGGSGGSGNHGGSVGITNRGAIVTEGDKGNGIIAQSIGGGGGAGGTAREINILRSTARDKKGNSKIDNVQLNSAVGGSGGTGSDGGRVYVSNDKDITTNGDLARGIFAQSIGGGGGAGGTGIRGIGSGEELVDLHTKANQSALGKTLNVIVGGNAGASGNGNEVFVSNSNGNISTAGLESHGIFAQSIGGGGGEAKNWVKWQDEATGGNASLGLKGVFGLGGAGGAAGNASAVTVTSDFGAIETTGAGAKGILAQSIGGGGGVAGNVDRALPDRLNVGALVGMARDGGSAGNGGAVSVGFGYGGISTRGDMADGVFAQSIGGGGGLGGGVGFDGLNNPLYSVTAGSVGGRGSASYVEVNLGRAQINTTGGNANGIFAQSAGGTATSTQNATAGSVSVSLYGTSVVAQGANSNGIFAQSVGQVYGDTTGLLGNGDISITVRGRDLYAPNIPESTVVGGGGIGAGVWIDGGRTNTVSNEGTITALSGLAIVGGSGNETVNNRGRIMGDVILGAGANSFTNHAGGTLVTGTVIEVGTGNTFTNRGHLSFGMEPSSIQPTLLVGNFVQDANSTWTISLGQAAIDGYEPFGISDQLYVTGRASLGGSVTTVNIDDSRTALPGSHYLLSAAEGVTGANFVLGSHAGDMKAGLTFTGFDYDASNVVLNTAHSTGTFVWDGRLGEKWNAGFSGGESNWVRSLGGTDFIYGTPGAATDVVIAGRGTGEVRTSLGGSDFQVNSLTFTSVATSAEDRISIDGRGNTLTIQAASGTGVTVESGAPAVTVRGDVTLAGAQTWTNHGAQALTVSDGRVSSAGLGLQIDGAGDVNVRSTLDLQSGALAKNGAGTLTLGGLGSTVGGVDVNAGRLVLDSGATLRVGGTLNQGAGTSTTVRDGANLSTSLLFVNSNDASPAGAVFTVSGPGSSLNAEGLIQVGQYGAGTLRIENGGTALTPSLYVGNPVLATSRVEVDGAGSSLAANAMILGFQGSASLAITNGATVQTSHTYVGAGFAGPAGTGHALVDGLGSRWEAGQLVVGDEFGMPWFGAAASTVTVQNGAFLLTADSIIGNGMTGAGVVSVTGPGSAWTNTGSLTVGNGGSAALTVADGAHVANGATTTNRGDISVTGATSRFQTGLFTQEGGDASMILHDNATFISTLALVQGGTFGGHGTIIGDVHASHAALQVGASPDSLTLHGNFNMTGGSLLFDIGSNGAGGYLYSTLFFDPFFSFRAVDTTLTFNFLAGVDAGQFSASGLFVLDTFFRLTNGMPFSSTYVDYRSVFDGVAIEWRGTDLLLSPPTEAAFWAGTPIGHPSVPDATSTAALCAIGLPALAFGSRRRRAS